MVVTTIPRTLAAFLMPFIQDAKRQGWAVAAVSGNGEEWEHISPHTDAQYVLSWKRTLARPDLLVTAAVKFRSAVSQFRPDIIHFHTPIASVVGRLSVGLSLRRPRPRMVYTAHGFHFLASQLTPLNAFALVVERIVARWTDALIVINDEDLQATSNWRFARGKVHRFNGIGVEPSRWRDEERRAIRGNYRRRLGLHEHVGVLVPAEFIPRKRHSDIIAAANLLRNTSLRFLFAGDGPLELRLRQEVVAAGLEEQVRFLGFRRDIRELLVATDGLLLASSREGLPRAVLEAMAEARPIIATDIRGTRELVTDTRALFPVGDVVRMADRLELLASGEIEPLTLPPQYLLSEVVRMQRSLYVELMKRGH